MATGTEPRVTAWDNPTWVLAVMHYPDEIEFLQRLATGGEITARRIDEREIQAAAARNGKAAGNVLAALYVSAASPWRIQQPSLVRAINVAEKLAYEDRNRGAPRGHTKIEACYDAMRPVAHLWAARRLHWEYQVQCPHDQLLRTPEGIQTLLRIARGVQDWALTWKAPRTKKRTLLLGSAPWLVPDDVAPMRPPWKHRPVKLLELDATYTTRRLRPLL